MFCRLIVSYCHEHQPYWNKRDRRCFYTQKKDIISLKLNQIEIAIQGEKGNNKCTRNLYVYTVFYGFLSPNTKIKLFNFLFNTTYHTIK